MNAPHSFCPAARVALLCGLVASAVTAPAALAADRLVDSFDTAKLHCGVDRLIFNDKDLGGKSHATQTAAGGVLKVEGQLVPARGMPGFVSIPLLLTADAKPQDVSAFEGVRLRVKVLKGSLCLQVATTDVQNFDYHTSAPIARGVANFQEVRIPFKALKRAWSEQTALNAKDVTSLNLVSVGTSPTDFAYEVDEVSFY